MLLSLALHALMLTAGSFDRLPLVAVTEDPVTVTVVVAARGSDDRAVASTAGVDAADAAAVPEDAAGSGQESRPAPESVPGDAGATVAETSAEPNSATRSTTEASPDHGRLSAPFSAAAVAGEARHSGTPLPSVATRSIATRSATRPLKRSSPLITASSAPRPRLREVPMTASEAAMLDGRLDALAETLAAELRPVDDIVWTHAGQRYTARVRTLPGGDDTTLERLAVDVATEVDGHRLATTVEYRRLAFSNYAQFVNRWDRDVQIHDDELDGRFHSNSMINLTYSRKAGPKFHGRVTTAARRVNMVKPAGRQRRESMFLDGIETGVRRIRLPANAVPLPDAAMLSSGRVHRFSTDTRIRFLPDGTFLWVSLDDGLFERREALARPNTYLLGEDGADLEVSGTVNGKVLVHTAGNITITGDLEYAAGPDHEPDGDDYLGLVAERSVEIADRKVTGPGDLTVHAAIYAKRLFRVRGFRRRGGDTLTVFGSLTAGSLTATEPRFATRIRFDPRLEDRRPPGFPVTDRYEMTSWNAAWTPIDDSLPDERGRHTNRKDPSR